MRFTFVCGNKKFRSKGQEVTWVKASKVFGRCHDYTVVDRMAKKAEQIKIDNGKIRRLKDMQLNETNEKKQNQKGKI